MLTILITILATAVAVSLAWAAVMAYKSWERHQAEVQGMQNKVIAALAATTTEVSRLASLIEQGGSSVSEAKETITKLLTGMIEVTKEQVAQMERVESAVQEFKRCVFGDGQKALQDYAEDSRGAETEHAILQAMRATGLPRESIESRQSENLESFFRD